MNHGKKFNKLGRTKAHRKALLRNLAAQLFEYGYIKTTLAKAKALRPYAEKLITKAVKAQKADTPGRRLSLLRIIAADIPGHEPYRMLTQAWGYICLERKGGYLRIVKMEARKGDNADQAMIGIVIEEPWTTRYDLEKLALNQRFPILAKKLIDSGVLIQRNIQSQWWLVTYPSLTVEAAIIEQELEAIIRLGTVANLKEANWPVFKSKYMNLSLLIEVTINNGYNVEFSWDDHKHIREIPGRNENQVRLMIDAESLDKFKSIHCRIKKSVPSPQIARPIKRSRYKSSNPIPQKIGFVSPEYCHINIFSPVDRLYSKNLLAT
ncbi:MAG: 50S ribosomal protein L17 [Chitinophagaceae bacterium]|nr:50S ribosomal protein L17 [Chitinophagaceae bacterium]